MHDPRLDALAQLLVTHSTRLQPGEKILIETFDIPEDMVIALIRAARQAGAVPLVSYKRNRIQRELIQAGQEQAMQLVGECETYRMERVDAYVGLRGSRNIADLSDVPAAAMELYERLWLQPVHFQVRVPRTKWVVLRWPSPSMAQQAKMSSDAFEDFYFDVCTLDYAKMAEAQKPLKALREQTDQVHITGPDTDLRFSIENIPAIPCSGEHNIPDGECFTAPVRDSVEGEIRFNTPTLYRGTPFDNIHLRFDQGRIVAASVAAATVDDMRAVTGRATPCQTSGSHKWKGTIPSRRPRATRSRAIPARASEPLSFMRAAANAPKEVAPVAP